MAFSVSFVTLRTLNGLPKWLSKWEALFPNSKWICFGVKHDDQNEWNNVLENLLSSSCCIDFIVHTTGSIKMLPIYDYKQWSSCLNWEMTECWSPVWIYIYIYIKRNDQGDFPLTPLKFSNYFCAKERYAPRTQLYICCSTSQMLEVFHNMQQFFYTKSTFTTSGREKIF